MGLAVRAAVLAATAAMFFAGCSTNLLEPERDANRARALARALAESATVAVARPGIKVCRAFQVGLVERDWIRGEVVDLRGDSIAVRIADAGKFPHSLNSVAVERGTVVWDAPSAWIPCVESGAKSLK